MANTIAADLRHPKERVYGTFMMIVGAFVWLLAALAIGGMIANHHLAPVFSIAFYVILFVLFGMIGKACYRAHIFGHYVLLSENQLPHLYDMVAQGANQLGLSTVPKAFVYNSNGLINAFAMRLLGGRYVFLTSALIDADNDQQVKFVIGHELGHHAAGHLDFVPHFLKLPAHFIPFLGPAYSRGRELTCDRIGAHLAQDQDASRGALQMLACGSARLNSALNRQAFEAQENQVPAIFGWLLLIFAHYPRHTQRVIALTQFAQ